MKILIVEDQEDFAKDVSGYLSQLDYVCELAHNYETALEKINLYRYDCILLDLMIPGGNGIQILEQLKNLKVKDAVIIISAKNSIEDKVKGLNIGADDYISKPLNLSELAARLFSVMRRNQFDNNNVLELDNIKVDLLSKSVLIDKETVNLTKKEYDLLLFFLSNKNKVLSKNAVAENLSGDMADFFDNFDFVYAHVKNLKKKLNDAGAKNYIKTLYGLGYKWEV
jgi:DNA-binding response OmpR family regulator